MKLNRSSFLLILAICTINVSKAFTRKVSLKDLTCEYKSNPLGVEVKNPALSWIISSDQHAIKQVAYQILVSSNLHMIKKGQSDVWNTGKVYSEQSVRVIYSGTELLSSKKYYWRVRIWDNKGNVSDWSTPASWQMGLLTQTDWKGANWIAYEKLEDSKKIIPAIHHGGNPAWGSLMNTLPLLRKEFAVKKPLKQAVVFISGLGHFDLSVNGKKVGDNFLDAGWSDYSKDALYVSFDLTSLLKNGSNALGVMLGNGFFHVPAERYHKLTGTFGYPKMICKLILEYKDGTREDIVSNQSWKTAPGPITFTSIFGGEDYDATLEQKGWDSPAFDDKQWKTALVVDGPPKLSSQTAEPLKVMQSFTPVKTTNPKPGIVVYDLGQNFSGIPKISVKGKRGSVVKIIPGEHLYDNGLVNQSASGSPSYFTYTLKGEGTETWQPQFTYYGFRYILIDGGVLEGAANPDNYPVITDLKGLHTRNSAATVGSFSCSNQLFNDIFKLIDWAIKSNMASVFTDCPHREKLGWLEQAHLLGNSVRYNYHTATFYRKIIQDMQMSQTKDGMVPNIAPEYVEFDTDFRDSPEWGSSSVLIPWALYQCYGDKEILKESYAMMKRYVDYLSSRSENHMVLYGLGDWFDIGPDGKSGEGHPLSTPKSVTATGIYYHDLTTLIKTAELLGKREDAKKYQGLADQVRSSFNKAFFNKETKQYSTGSQTANALAIALKLVEPQYKDAVVANIITDIHNKGNRLTTGEVGYRYLIDVLEAEGRSDVIYYMNNRTDVPGYGYQLAHGATSLMEDWGAKKSLGNNHCMMGHLMRWFYSGLGGIRVVEGAIAFKEIEIKPEVVGDVTFAKASYQSPYGLIRSEWKKSDDVFLIDIEIPSNTTAIVYLPALQSSSIMENSIDVAKNKAIKFTGYDKGKAVFEIGSGKYTFKVMSETATPVNKD